MLVGFPFPEDFYLLGSLFPRNCVVESLTVANSFLFLWVLVSSLDRVSLHTYLLESLDLSSSTVRNISVFPSPETRPKLQLCQKLAFQSCLSRGKR